jgi:hypothetical protein
VPPCSLAPLLLLGCCAAAVPHLLPLQLRELLN